MILEDKRATLLKRADNNVKLLLDVPSVEEQLNAWKSNRRYPEVVRGETIDTKPSTVYLRTGNLFAET